MKAHLRGLLFGATLCIPATALAQDAPAKSELRVLFVGHDPEAPEVPFASMATDRTYELYRERTAAFSALLREHFEHVKVVYGPGYDASMSDDADVTLFDARPTPLKEAVREVDEATGKMKYEPASYLPHDFSRPALMIAENSPRIGEPLGLKLDWL